ncbi:MAG: hypothetical protein HRU50_01450 [Winogradskyella sp.]|uniref:hypothetical protein n=1 Tax=Winogradskyella sp. TaxID=1883156 RepID=UPI0025FA8956|nr:hypothetical protein [Winogradskyella sp.]NRB58589.1 hypothetical protein [Winogradskyella sp.]
MKKLIVFFSIVFVGCNSSSNINLEDINGYWEIEEVRLHNGSGMKYDFNATIDYIKINDSLKGFRKKLKPGINDTYYTSDDAERLIIKSENNSLNIYYSTPYDSWKETILELNSEKLRVINQNKDVYLYKRYTPINFDLGE